MIKDEKEIAKSNGAKQLGVTVSIDEKAKSIFGWINLIIMRNQPFRIVEDEVFRNAVRFKSTSVNTVKKYLDLLVRNVEKKVADSLPDLFGIVIDGWTESDTHFVAIFASYSDRFMNDVTHQPLLACGPMGDETSQSAEAFIDHLNFILTIYGKTIDNISFLVSDNTATNPAIARKIGVPFVGCMSHRLSLAVNAYLSDKKVNLLVKYFA